MAVTNTVEVTITNCNSIAIVDTSDWDTVDPVVNIDTIDITVEVDGTETELPQIAGYTDVDLLTITPSDLGQTGDDFTDGIYKFTVVFTDTGVATYTVVCYVAQDCTIQCQLDQLILQVADETCDDCRRDSAIEVYELMVSIHALHSALACNNISRAELLLNCIEDALANFDCKNC